MHKANPYENFESPVSYPNDIHELQDTFDGLERSIFIFFEDYFKWQKDINYSEINTIMPTFLSIQAVQKKDQLNA